MGDYEPRNFLQPCLLLLLRERSDHGYDLVNRLRALHAVDGDAGAVYRALRGLEKQGLVRSTWQTSEAGPARRTYQVTRLGVATLDRQAAILEATHRTLHLFRERYRQMSGDPIDNGTQVNGIHGGAVHGNGAARNGAHANGAHGNGAPGNGSGNGVRKVEGNGGGTAGGGHGDPGGRGVRPPPVPGQRAGG